MYDTTVGGDLPSPAQMRALHEVSRAVENARRMGEASRAVITGNIALAICMIESLLVVVHDDRAGLTAPFITCGLSTGYLALLFLSLRWMARRRVRELVTVVDRREEAARAAAARPWRAAAIVCAFVIFQVGCILGWGIAFPYMSNRAILASLSIGPLFGTLYFVRRFAIFRFWEDLLFAGSVALAYAPFLLQQWWLTPLCFLALLLVFLGTASLHCRWTSWTSSIAEMGGEDVAEGARP